MEKTHSPQGELLFDWRKCGALERGRLERCKGVAGGPLEYLLIRDVTGAGGWEAVDVPVEPGARYRLTWSVKCVGEEPFKTPEPRDELERELYFFLNKTYLPFNWYAATDFIGLEMEFFDAGGKEVSTRRQPMAVETHSNVLAGVTREDYYKYRGDMTRYWAPIWFEFEPPDDADSVTIRFLIESRSEINSGMALARFGLDRVTPEGEPREGCARYVIKVYDFATGRPTSARVAISDATGEFHVPDFSIANANPFPWFYCLSGEATLELPAGRYRFEAVKGLEYEMARFDSFYVAAGQTEIVEMEMARAIDMSGEGWFAGDHHLHISGHATKDYPMMDVMTGLELAQADGMSYIPYQADYFSYRTRGGEPLRGPSGALGEYSCELASQVWGHYNTFGARAPYEHSLSGHVLYPTMYDVVKTINERGGACVAAHPTQMICQPYNSVHVRQDMARAVANPGRLNTAKELPLVLLLGEPCGFDLMIADGWWGQRMATREYYRLLDFGFRLGVGGSTDTGVNSANCYFPSVRTYIRAEELAWPALAAGMRNAHTFATNGPVVLVDADGRVPGDTITADKGDSVRVKVRAFSPWGLAHAELVYNGQTVARRELTGQYEARMSFEVPMEADGWLVAVVRGPGSPWVNSSMFMEMERAPLGQMAHTSPVFVRFDGRPFRPGAESADYYRRWVTNLRKIAEAHKYLLEADAERMALAPNEVWDIVMGRIDQGLGIIDRIEHEGWPAATPENDARAQ